MVEQCPKWLLPASLSIVISSYLLLLWEALQISRWIWPRLSAPILLLGASVRFCFALSRSGSLASHSLHLLSNVDPTSLQWPNILSLSSLHWGPLGWEPDARAQTHYSWGGTLVVIILFVGLPTPAVWIWLYCISATPHWWLKSSYIFSWQRSFY